MNGLLPRVRTIRRDRLLRFHVRGRRQVIPPGNLPRKDGHLLVGVPRWGCCRGYASSSRNVCRGSLRGDGCVGPLPEAPAAEPRACPFVKPLREPDAGDPQVRFDERRRETEPGSRLRHRHYGESRRKQLLPRPTATAPAADSTFLGAEHIPDDCRIGWDGSACAPGGSGRGANGSNLGTDR